ncbi:MAG TPA: glycoside hydrolase family 18 protein [Oscillospiraceae bacterium]|nr:glycoside hydrolase family 18 protein [Oscillospiraceae bacterium]
MTNKNANYVCGSYMPGRNISKEDIEKIDFKVITHVFLAFSLLEIDENGNYVPVISEPLKKGIALVLNHIKEIGADTKVLVSIGGYGAGGFCETASAKESRKAFAKKCAEILDEHKIDGIDMDWEYPTIAYEDEGVNACENCNKDFILLMEEIKDAIGESLLTAAVGSDHWYKFDLKRLNKSVDYINVMTYDMNQTAHSSMELTKSAVEGWGNGIDRNKVVLGVPFYARCTNEKYEWKGYSELMGLVENKTAEILYTDDQDYVVIDGNKLSIDTEKSIAKKISYIKENGFAGIFNWQEFTDYNGSLRHAMSKINRGD